MRNTASSKHVVDHEDCVSGELSQPPFAENAAVDHQSFKAPRLTLVMSSAADGHAPTFQASPTGASSIVERYRRREAEKKTSSIYDPALAEPSPSQLALAGAVRFDAPLPDHVEQQLVDVLKATPGFGETIEAAFTRKENEARELMAQLSVMQARSLHARLQNPANGDVLAEAFGRMLATRRERLLAFLADARRREALASSRRASR